MQGSIIRELIRAWGIYEIDIAYSFWLARNEVVFEGIRPSAKFVLEKARA